MVSALETIALIGPNDKSLSKINVLKALMCEPSQRGLQLACFCTLIQLGFEGFMALMELAVRDFGGI